MGFPAKWWVCPAALLMLLCLGFPPPAGAAEQELNTWHGQALSPFQRDYDNSIDGPQKLDRRNYRLRVDGLVERPLDLSYDAVIALGSDRRVVTLNCVEGWGERLLYDGVPLRAVLEAAGVRPEAVWVVFHSPEGYSSALPISYLFESRALLGYRINGLTLDDRRGWPFQLVAEGKFGYKWVKWITRIELTKEEVKGYWEQRGYSNEAPVK